MFAKFDEIPEMIFRKKTLRKDGSRDTQMDNVKTVYPPQSSGGGGGGGGV